MKIFKVFGKVARFFAFSEGLMYTALAIIWLRSFLGAVFDVHIALLSKTTDWIAFIFGILVGVARIGGLRGKPTE